ncbi:hypothetical protein HZS_1390 [Henneguya salminicola]|nr:hypothetical protein HZS_1390 [Henneguya salminicola]
MTVVLKISGFSPETSAIEIVAFLKEAYLKDYDLYLSMDKGGPKKNLFSGLCYIIVNSEFDAASVLRLRDQRFRHYIIKINRSSLYEIQKEKLYPELPPHLIADPDEENTRNHKKIETNLNVRQRKNESKQKNSNKLFKSIENCHTNIVPDRNYNGRDSTQEESGPKNGQSVNSQSQFSRVMKDAVQPIPYDCYVKIFYLGPEVTKKDVFSFIQPYSFPVDILFSKFAAGPHANKNTGEAYILLSSTKEALKCIKLTSEKVGNFRIMVVFPSKEEIDTVIYQNEKKQSIPSSHTTTPTSPKKESGQLAYSILEAVTNIINKGSSHRNDSTMVENLDRSVNARIFDDIEAKTTKSIPLTYTFMRILNVPSHVPASELESFFFEFPFVSSSLKKVFTSKTKSEWEIAFESHETALIAVRKLNYRLIRYQPVELKIV